MDFLLTGEKCSFILNICCRSRLAPAECKNVKIHSRNEGIGWHDATIRPYGPIEMNQATVVLHYAQETFEGLKAYRRADGQIQLFRPEMNARRMINSN